MSTPRPSNVGCCAANAFTPVAVSGIHPRRNAASGASTGGGNLRCFETTAGGPEGWAAGGWAGAGVAGDTG